MTWADAAHPPVPQAALIALADVLVTTDELSAQRDAQGGQEALGSRSVQSTIKTNTCLLYGTGTQLRSGPAR